MIDLSRNDLIPSEDSANTNSNDLLPAIITGIGLGVGYLLTETFTKAKKGKIKLSLFGKATIEAEFENRDED